MISFFKGITILLTGNLLSAIFGALCLLLITYYGDYNQINYINYTFALASTIFTFLDFGRGNSILLSKKTNNQKFNDYNFSFLLIISILFLNLAFSSITEVKILDTLLIVSLLISQRTFYSVCISLNNDVSAVISQVILSLLKLFVVILLLISELNIEFLISLVYSISLIVLSVYYLKFYKHFSLKSTFSRIKNLFSDMKFIGPNNAFLVLTDRFEILFFIYLINDKEFASFSSLLGISYLIGIFVDALMKKLYINVRNQKISNRSRLYSIIKTNFKSIFLFLIISLTVIPYVADILLNFKLQNVKEIVFFCIIFQLLRFISQLLELDFISHKSKNILFIKIINLFFLFMGIISSSIFKLSFIHILIVFCAIRLFLILPLVSFNFKRNFELS